MRYRSAGSIFFGWFALVCACSAFGTDVQEGTDGVDAGDGGGSASDDGGAPESDGALVDAPGDVSDELLKGVARGCTKTAKVCDDFDDGTLEPPYWTAQGATSQISLVGAAANGSVRLQTTGSQKAYLLREEPPSPRTVISFGAALNVSAIGSTDPSIDYVELFGIEEGPHQLLVKLYGLTLLLGETGEEDVVIAPIVPNVNVKFDVVIVFAPVRQIIVRFNDAVAATRSHAWSGGTGDMRLFAGVYFGNVKTSFTGTFDDVFFDWK